MPADPRDHLDDDVLSELVDTAAPHPHLEACQPCRDRLQRMGDAAALIGSPVAPLPAGVVADLVERATNALVVPIGGHRRVPGPGWIAAVAAAAVLLLGLPVVLRSTNDRGASSDLATTAADESATRFATAEGSAGGADAGGTAALTAEDAAADAADGPAARGAVGAGSAAAPAPVPDLGAVDDPVDLVGRLRARMSTEAEQKSAESTVAACEDTARRTGAGRLGSFVYAALVEWRGEPAEVLVFLLTEPSGDDTRQAYVMSRSACAVLADPRF